MRFLLCALLATTWPDATTRDLVDQSDRVTCVKCESCEARLDPLTGWIFTHVRLRVVEDLKGTGDSSLVELRFIGGRVGGRALVVDGMPQFPVGEESVVMLGRRNALGYPVVTQARRGVIPLRKDASGRRLLGASVSGFPDLKDRKRVSLDEFRAALRKAAR